jgi:hypothetical protein
MASDAGNSTSSADRHLGLSQSSSIPSNNEIFYHNFMWNNNSDDNPFNSNGARDDGDDSGTSKSEDLEVRMDLTDDLLHMVKCIVQIVLIYASHLASISGSNFVLSFFYPGFLVLGPH